MQDSETTQHQLHCRSPQGYVCSCVKEPATVEEFIEEQFADPEIKAVYERLGKR